MKRLALFIILALSAFVPSVLGQTVQATKGINYGNGTVVHESSGNGAPTDACTGAERYTQNDATAGLNIWQCISGHMVNQGNSTAISGSLANAMPKSGGAFSGAVTGPTLQYKPLVAPGLNGVVGNGTTDDTAAMQAVVNGLSSGGTIEIAPGTYNVCGLQISGSVKLLGHGAGAWGSPTGFVGPAPVVFKCASNSTPVIHVINTAGNTTLLHNGPDIEDISVQDSSNSGSGGSGVGGILVETTNRGVIRKISCSNFSAAGAYCVKFSQPASTLYDASYWTLEQPFVRNTDIGIDLETYADGTLILGGEVVGNTYGLYAPHTVINSAHFFNYGTSYECIATNATCVYLGGIGSQVFARYEGNSTTSVGVHLDSNSGHNVVGGTFNDLKVGVFNEGSSNSFDTTDVSTVKTYIIDRGFATRWSQAGIGNYEQDNPANAYDPNSNTFHGFMYGPTGVSGLNMQFELGSRNGYLLKGAPGNFYPIGDSAITVASGVATITFPSTQQFTTGDVLNINSTRSAAGVGPLGAACTGVAVVDTTHVTCTTSLADGTYSNGWIWGISGLWRASMHGGHVYGECQGATLLNDAGNGATALDTNAVCLLYNPNGFTARFQIYANTGLTVGSTYTPTLVATFGTSGLVLTSLSTTTLNGKTLVGAGASIATGPSSGTVLNNAACFADTVGTLKDCGTPPGTGSGSASLPHVTDSSGATQVAVSLPVAIDDGTGNGGAAVAGFGPAPTTSSTTATLHANSTTHRWQQNPAATGETVLPGVPTAGITAGHTVIMGANGFDLDDGGAPAPNLGSGTPSLVADSSAGTSPTLTLISGATDRSGWVSLVVGTSPNSSAGLITVQFGGSYTTIPKCDVSPANAAAAALTGAAQPYVAQSTSTTAQFVIFQGPTALTAGTTYIWRYSCSL